MFDGTGCRIVVTAAVLLIAAQTCAAQGMPASGATAASAAIVASTPIAASQVTVQAGQSLNDIAIRMTQSHDRAVLARAARAIFDANPSAFMKNDPSRLKVGAVLNVPVLDATGAAVAAATATAASAPGGASSAAAMAGNAASAPSAVSAAPAPASAAGASMATAQEAREQPAASAASSTTTAAAAATTTATTATPSSAASASVAESASTATATATASATTAASSPANAATPASASVPASVSQATGASIPQAAAASSGNVWSGSIQSAPSQPAAGASGALAASAGAPQAASQAHPQVSSLQQLLALKNRVLMELQKHGIGKSAGTPQAASSVAANGQPAAVAGASAGASTTAGTAAPGAHPLVAPMAAQQTAGSTVMSKQGYVGVAALIGAVLAAMVAGLAMRRRKRADVSASSSTSARAAAEEGPSAADVAPPHDAGRNTASADDAMPKSGEHTAAHETQQHDDADAVPSLTERVSPVADHLSPQPHETPDQPAKPAKTTETVQTIAGSTAALGFAAAHEERSEPPTREEPLIPDLHEQLGAHESPGELPAAQTEHVVDEVAPAASVEESHAPIGEPNEPAQAELPPDVTMPAEHEPVLSDHFESEPVIDLASDEPTDADADTAQAHAEPHQPADQQDHALSGHEPDENRATLPQFPRAALDAFGSLDMSLPPRADADAPAVPPATPTVQPVVEPEITASHAVPPHEPEPPRVGEQIEAGTAGPGAIAGMGAAKYGPLALDFDLELPPGPAQPLPTFTPEELARIARNKLELAAEYIELGDVAGARTLINEVIESNDAATRNEARAMLSTLAPLS
ncbi:FimV/HubP family polar landmark protein [Paraburkholderia rhizosphaerae]|nr:FimV/HubP family polar landmark protein [Paraburkholderia rhizosphaerae]